MTPDRARGAPAGDAGRDALDTAVVAWALLGVVVLLSTAVARLAARGIETLRNGLTPWEWGALVGLTATFVYGEGVRALQRRWVPHLLDRVRRLRGERDVLLRLAAPLYGLSLVGASPRALFRAWAGTAAIVAAVMVVRAFPEPWRGITDLAVAAAVGWGLLVILRRAPRAFR